MDRRYYRIRFYTKKNGYRDWVIDISSKNSSEAIEKAKNLWYKNSNCHMFGIDIKMIRDNEEIEYNYFKMI